METILAYMVGFFPVGEFTYATENSKGGNAVAMATTFGQK